MYEQMANIKNDLRYKYHKSLYRDKCSVVLSKEVIEEKILFILNFYVLTVRLNTKIYDVHWKLQEQLTWSSKIVTPAHSIKPLWQQPVLDHH